MNRLTTRGLLLLLGLLLTVGLPLAGKWSRLGRPQRCEFDGLRIEPRYAVRVVDRAGASHRLCCVRCALRWRERQAEAPAAVYVTDEASGLEIPARSAHFVFSTVVTNRVTHNRIHAFGDIEAAEEHARTYDGSVLTDDERPFADWEDSP